MIPPLSRRAALFEAPPAMFAQAWPWVSRIHAGMYLAGQPALRETDGRFADVPEHRGSAVRDFPIDLSGWRHGDTEVPENWARYKLVLSPKSGKNLGWWSGKTHVIVLYLGNFLDWRTGDFAKLQAEVRDTLAHELTHLAQWLLRSVRVLKVMPGLPSRRRRREKAYDIWGRPLGWSRLPSTERESWMEEHALREMEFQPLLQNEVAAFRRVAADFDPDHRRDLLRFWLLPQERVKPKVKPLPKWWWWAFVAATSTHGYGLFPMLYHSDPAKWRDAASKFTKSVEDLL